MTQLKVLFVGGTGIISGACARLAVERGIDLYLLNRGASQKPAVAGSHILQADITDGETVRRVLGSHQFDAVVDWVAFTPEDIDRDLTLFDGRFGQYVFISSASAYQTPPESLPVTEETPLSNPYWGYSQLKIAAERRLAQAGIEGSGIPYTIIRPSHTYDETMVPFDGGWTVVERMRKGRGIVVPGDGTSLWTITHSDDFAVGLVGILGNPSSLGEAIHITSDYAPTWNSIYRAMAQAAGCDPDLVHISSDAINAVDPVWGAALLGDKSNTMIFDNTKIKRLVPDFAPSIRFVDRASEIVEWFDADPTRKHVDAQLSTTMDALIAAFRPRAL